MKIGINIPVCIAVLVFTSLATDSFAQDKRGMYANEIGLHFGNFFIAGDVEHTLLPGWGAGIHYRYALNHAISIRPQLFYGITYGLDARPTSDGIFQEGNLFQGYSVEQPWFYAYQTKLFRIGIQGILELTNLGYRDKLRNFNLYLLGGIGLNSHGTWLNLRDTDNNPYLDLLQITSYNDLNDYNTVSGREAIREAIRGRYDNTYETPANKEVGRFRLGDETNISLEASLGLGISYRLTPRFNIAIEHEFFFSGNDYLDGLRWRTEADLTPKDDIGHYTNIRLAININSKRRREPLYWINPFQENLELIDSLEARIGALEQGLQDTDNDGVIDAIDQQPNSASNCPVDTKGITLDSDRDGIADCYDKFPFGDKSDIEAFVENYLKSKESQTLPRGSSTITNTRELEAKINKSSLENANLPLVFFGTDSHEVMENQYAALAQLVTFIKEKGIKCMRVTGHTDTRFDEDYNLNLGQARAEATVEVLVKEFGLDPAIFKFQTEGEAAPLLALPRSALVEFVNRRVEFRVCE